MRPIENILLILTILLFIGCNRSPKEETETEAKVMTPVTVTTPEYKPVSEVLNFRSVSAYQKKNVVKANVNGYIEKTFVAIGDQVPQGKVLFTVQTKEAKALGNFSGRDSLIKFKGESSISAPSSGVVTEVNKQANDYINDGDQLCIMAEKSSFVFLLNVPFEQNKIISIGMGCRILLPDSTRLNGTITAKLSTIDPVSQTQVYVVRPQNTTLLSENLSAVVQVIKSTVAHAQVLNKSCVLSDETMEKFWVMKLINDSMAVKVPVTKGIANDSQIEILSPVFKPDDKIIKTGSYGLADTAYVKIIHP